MFLALHFLVTPASLFLRLSGCLVSFEGTLTALAVAIHEMLRPAPNRRPPV